MSKRISISIDEDIAKKLRVIQSKKITKLSKSVSFSSVINDELRKVVKLR